MKAMSTLRRFAILPFAAVLLLVVAPAWTTAQQVYYPGAADDWERRTPEQVGMDASLLEQAIQFAKDNETQAPRDLEQNHYLSFGREPHGEGIGPFKASWRSGGSQLALT
jgi:hypothetical protein